MRDRTIYANAPITEAVIDIRTSLPAEVDLELLASGHEAERDRYPDRKDRMIVSAQMTFGTRISTQAKQEKNGFVFTSLDGRRIFQARLDGFTFSELAPYDRWETFVSEAQRLWKVYSGTVNPTSVTRIGVRFINRIILPAPLQQVEEYLRTGPEVSPDIPYGSLSGFFLQLRMPQDDIDNCTAIINETIVPSDSEDKLAILLDIDVFREPVVFTLANEDEMWSAFAQFHDRKNEIFEACITDRTRELIS